MADENDLGFVTRFANSVGTSENVIRLMISLFSGYPLAIIYRKVIHGTSPFVQHLYFILTGVWLGYFNFGSSVIHSIINILLNYAIIFIFRGTSFSVCLAFVINLSYLIVGYWYTSAVDYAITWTTPHCVLTLRLTGLMFDYYDGRRKVENLSADEAETALRKKPSLLEMAGHIYFFGGYLVGPQFPMKRYLSFVNGEFSDKVSGGPPASTNAALSRLGGGIAYIVLYQITSLFLPDTFLLSTTFQDLSVNMKCLTILVWGKLLLYRYVGVWLITEGACILTGLTYNGKDENGNDLWDSCANIHVRDYERASTLQELIKAFNVNTNKWMFKYIFKRMKFLGNKAMSQFVTLMYLAIWHGLYTGYFVTFFLEFVTVKFERELGTILSHFSVIQQLKRLPGAPVAFWLIKKVSSQFMLSYALVSFCLLTYNSYMQVYSSVLFVVHVICLAWIPIYPRLKKAVIGRVEANGVQSQDADSHTRTKTD